MAQSALLQDARFESPGYPSDHLQHVLVFKNSDLHLLAKDSNENAPRINNRASDDAWDTYAVRLDRDLQAWEARFSSPLPPARLSQAHRAWSSSCVVRLP